MGDGTDLDISNTPTVEEIIKTETVDEPNIGIETIKIPINYQISKKLLNNEKKQFMIIHTSKQLKKNS
jgi:hypothetical protein